MVKINNKVWQQKLIITDGSNQSLADRCEKLIVVFFYPRANTPGCTTESKDFSAMMTEFEDLGCHVLGVSMDSLQKQQNFKKKYHMNIELVADIEGVLCKALDVIKEKKMYGKTFMGIERSTFLCNKAGEIIHQWRKVKVANHVDDVLRVVKNIQ
jgi:peroxiredoxin Q/BCP